MDFAILGKQNFIKELPWCTHLIIFGNYQVKRLHKKKGDHVSLSVPYVGLELDLPETSVTIRGSSPSRLAIHTIQSWGENTLGTLKYGEQFVGGNESNMQNIWSWIWTMRYDYISLLLAVIPIPSCIVLEEIQHIMETYEWLWWGGGGVSLVPFYKFAQCLSMAFAYQAKP